MAANNRLDKTYVLPLLLIIGPSIGVIASAFLFALVNLLLNPTFWMTPDGEPVAQTPLFITLINWVLYIIGITGLIGLIPCLCVGVYLLLSRKKGITTKKR